MSATKLQSREVTPFVASIAAEVGSMMGRRGRMSASELARRTGLPYTTLTRCLAGKRPFAVDELERVAAVLECEVSDFLGRANLR